MQKYVLMMSKKNSAKKLCVNKKTTVGNNGKLKRGDFGCDDGPPLVPLALSIPLRSSVTPVHKIEPKSIGVRLMSSNLFVALVITTICGICYSNSMQCEFVFDDISAIRDNRDLRPYTSWKNVFLNDFWGTPIQKVRTNSYIKTIC